MRPGHALAVVALLTLLAGTHGYGAPWRPVVPKCPPNAAYDTLTRSKEHSLRHSRFLAVAKALKLLVRRTPGPRGAATWAGRLLLRCGSLPIGMRCPCWHGLSHRSPPAQHTGFGRETAHGLTGAPTASPPSAAPLCCPHPAAAAQGGRARQGAADAHQLRHDGGRTPLSVPEAQRPRRHAGQQAQDQGPPPRAQRPAHLSSLAPAVLASVC